MKPKLTENIVMHGIRNPEDISAGVETKAVPIARPQDIGDALDFVYVRYNIPGPDRRIKEYYEKFEGCKCTDMESCSQSCPCVARFGAAYDTEGHLVVVDPYKPGMRPILECNMQCQCQETCKNRVVQRGISFNLEVFKTKQKGYGLRCKEPIPKNAFVCEYAGELLTPEIAKKRTKSLKNLDSNYILVVREHSGNTEPRVTFIDPTYIGNVGRFINHSCDPNLYMVPVRVKNNIPHVALFALKDIGTGDELCYDYSGNIQSAENNSSETDENTDAVERKRSKSSLQEERNITSASSDNRVETEKNSNTLERGPVRHPCFCGAKHCRGLLPFDPTLYQD